MAQLKGHLFIAMRKKREGEQFPYVIRVGYSERNMPHWVRLYRKEGFRKVHVRSISVINQTGERLTLERARELLLYNIAERLKDANVAVKNVGNCEYAYFITYKKPILELIDELKDGFTIVNDIKPEEHVVEQVEEVKSSRCLIM